MENKSERIDTVYKMLMLIMGILTALLFILSLISLIEFPSAFKYLALGMIGTSVLFILFRTLFNYRNTFRVK